MVAVDYIHGRRDGLADSGSNTLGDHTITTSNTAERLGGGGKEKTESLPFKFHLCCPVGCQKNMLHTHTTYYYNPETCYLGNPYRFGHIIFFYLYETPKLFWLIAHTSGDRCRTRKRG